ncbi:MAG TPA: NAD(P)-dependent oxidoreductase, partial [Mycobacteriales bacterium]|nr:NAD(P)-dependent oxidoreductase [Mycobacteriales bacterium]
YRTDYFDSENSLMSFNIYRAAVEAAVPRVIMASSVHADKFVDRASSNLLNPYSLPLPDSPYGAGKCTMESLGRYYANSKGLEVICVRFGGVNSKNVPPDAPYSERQVWLSHRDCANLISRCIDADEIPNNYSIIYGVSRNRDRMHDYTNPLGWEPQDGAL